MGIIKWNTQKSNGSHYWYKEIKDLSYNFFAKQPGADCGTAYELVVFKFQIKLNLKNKTNQFPQCDLEHIPIIFQGER